MPNFTAEDSSSHEISYNLTCANHFDRLFDLNQRALVDSGYHLMSFNLRAIVRDTILDKDQIFFRNIRLDSLVLVIIFLVSLASWRFVLLKVFVKSTIIYVFIRSLFSLFFVTFSTFIQDTELQFRVYSLI